MSALLPTYARYDVKFVSGEGAYLFSETGDRYLDFGAGIAVSALGHAHPKLVAALKDQAEKLWHTSNLYKVEGQEELAKKLADATFADKVFFANSGAEAMECAIKMARKYHYASGHPERYRLITFEGAFHGRTLATIAAGGQAKHLEGFGPATEGFDQVKPGDIEAVRAVITDETAGIIIEPIQGEGGIQVIDPSFIRALKKLTDENGLLLIFDEVQTGMGRTGSLFAYQKLGVTPDIMAIAKGIGGGFPLGACLASEEAAKGMTAGSHGSTFGGNPLAMAVGNAVFDAIAEPGFLENVNKMGLRLKQKFAAIADEFPDIIANVRGEGLMLGFKCVRPAQEVAEAFMKAKILTVGAGDNVVRLLPPLIIGEAEIDDAASRVTEALSSLSGKSTNAL